jgi:hypothetical protein
MQIHRIFAVDRWRGGNAGSVGIGRDGGGFDALAPVKRTQ